MDARLDTLNDELCQVNTHVGRIAQQQAVIGGFTVATSPSPLASENESDDGSGSDDAAEDASSPSDDEMSTGFTYPLSLVTKKGNSFDMRVVIYIGGELVYEIFYRGSVYTLTDVVRTYVFFSFHLLEIHCSYFVIANLILMMLYI